MTSLNVLSVLPHSRRDNDPKNNSESLRRGSVRCRCRCRRAPIRPRVYPAVIVRLMDPHARRPSLNPMRWGDRETRHRAAALPPCRLCLRDRKARRETRVKVLRSYKTLESRALDPGHRKNRKIKPAKSGGVCSPVSAFRVTSALKLVTDAIAAAVYTYKNA